MEKSCIQKDFAKLSINSDKSISNDNEPTCNTTPSRKVTESDDSKYTPCPNRMILSGYLIQKEIKRKRTRNPNFAITHQGTFDQNDESYDSTKFNDYLFESPIKLYSSITQSNTKKTSFVFNENKMFLGGNFPSTKSQINKIITCKKSSKLL